MVDSCNSIKLENTLEDGAWKDSFDKILEPRPVLRELKVLKRSVRASFNIDSSVENSGRSDLDASGLLAPPVSCLVVNQQGENDERRSTISTPVAAGRLALDPFKCSLSPIGAWKLRFFNKADKATTRRTITEESPLHATPINPDIMVVEYNESQKDNSSSLIAAAPKEFSPLPMPPRCSTLKEGRRTHSQRHVCIQSVMDRPPLQKKKSSVAAQKRSGVLLVEQQREGPLHATPITPVVEYNESQKDNSSSLIAAAPKEFSPLPMPPRCSTLKEGRRTHSQRHVCIQSVMDQPPLQKKKSSVAAQKRSGVLLVEQQREGPLHATPITPVVEYNESQKDNSSSLIAAAPKEFSPLPMPPRCSTLKEGRRTHSQRHVCIQSVMDQPPLQKKKSSVAAQKRSGVLLVEQQREGPLHATPITPVVEYNESQKDNSSSLIAAAPKEFSPLPMPPRCSTLKEGRRTHSQRHVCIQSVMDQPPLQKKTSSVAAQKRSGVLLVEQQREGPLHATPITPVVEYNESQKDNSSSLIAAAPKEFSPLPMPPRCSTLKEGRRTHSQRHVCIQSVMDQPPLQKKKSSVAAQKRSGVIFVEQQREGVLGLTLPPGKWRKSLNMWRRTQQQQIVHQVNDTFDNSVEFVAHLGTIAGRRKSIFLKPERLSESFAAASTSRQDDWQYRVLKRCQQKAPMPFNAMYSAEKLKNCKKIGEGAYGEVFLNAATKRKFGEGATVLKIIPIEGKEKVNGEVQKTFEQILTEVVISIELSSLRDLAGAAGSTPGFVGVKKVACVKGAYPKHLIKLWEEYDEKKGSENDHPVVFTDTQLYMVLELEFGGQDLEAFEFANAEQTYYALQQMVFTLAVAEEVFQFEHRDLHWGNVLILNTSLKQLKYTFNNKQLLLPTKGIKITIIDYTLSRMTFDDYCFYNDLSCDEELFAATGDYQFDIYRIMRDLLKNNWESFEARTNIFWISYIISKLIDGVSYKNTRTKTHSMHMKKLQHLKDIILDFDSAAKFAQHLLEMT